MKLDIKTILILVLLGLFLIFGSIWFFGGNRDMRKRVKELEKENKILEKQKEDAYLDLSKWKLKFDSLQVIENKTKEDFLNLEKKVKDAESTASQSQDKLDKILEKLAKIKKQIADFEKNPPNRTGDDLLNSIKNKTK